MRFSNYLEAICDEPSTSSRYVSPPHTHTHTLSLSLSLVKKQVGINYEQKNVNCV